MGALGPTVAAPTRPLTGEDVRAYRQADSDSVPILSIDDFVPSESTMHLPLDKLVTRFAFFVFLILVAAAVLVEVIRIALGS